MAVRFRINPYSGVTPIAQAFGNLAQAFISGPSQFEIDKLAAEGRYADVRTQDVQRGISADAEARRLIEAGGPFDARKTGAILLGGGRKGDDISGVARVFTYLDPQSTVDQRDRSYGAAGGPYSGTETGFKIEDTTKRRGQDVAAGAVLGAARIRDEGETKRARERPHNVGQGDAVFFIPGDPRFAGQQPGAIPAPKVLPPIELDPGKGYLPQPGDPRVPQGFVPGSVPVPKTPEAQSTVGKLMADRDRLPPDHPDRPKFDDAIAKTITASVTERNQKISALVAQGMTVEDATAVTDGVKKIQIDQSSGRVYLVDMRDPTNVKEVPIKPATSGVQPPGAPPAPTATATQRRAGDTTGVIPSILEGVSGTLGQVAPKTFGSPEVTRNRQDIGIINELAVEALLKNSRASVAEQERIRALLPTTGVFTSPQDMATRLEGLRDLTVRRMEMDLAVLNSPVPYSREARQQAEERYRKSEMLLREIDRFASPGGAPAAPGAAPPPTGQQGGGPPAGSLKEGVETTFANGQTWTLRGGQPVRVR